MSALGIWLRAASPPKPIGHSGRRSALAQGFTTSHATDARPPPPGRVKYRRPGTEYVYMGWMGWDGSTQMRISRVGFPCPSSGIQSSPSGPLATARSGPRIALELLSSRTAVPSPASHGHTTGCAAEAGTSQLTVGQRQVRLPARVSSRGTLCRVALFKRARQGDRVDASLLAMGPKREGGGKRRKKKPPPPGRRVGARAPTRPGQF